MAVLGRFSADGWDGNSAVWSWARPQVTLCGCCALQVLPWNCYCSPPSCPPLPWGLSRVFPVTPGGVCA